MPKSPEGPPPPPIVQRMRVRYTKRGRLRFTSHRDIARVLERAIRRAGIPIACSAGFSPHPKISYAGACPTGVASEAEYLELGLSQLRDPDTIRADLDAALPPGIDVLEVVAVVPGEPALADRLDASIWSVGIPGVTADELFSALETFMAADVVPVARRTKEGTREVDARGAVVIARVSDEDTLAALAIERLAGCAMLHLVVRHATPAVRPDDVLAGLRSVAGLESSAPPMATRISQGQLAGDGQLVDPLAPHVVRLQAPTAAVSQGSPT